MNWLALSQTLSLFFATAAFANIIRLYFLDRKARLLHKVWERGAYMLIGNYADGQEILDICELCRIAVNEIADDMRSINPSYWILSSRKQYNIPVILERFATLQKSATSRPRNQYRNSE